MQAGFRPDLADVCFILCAHLFCVNLLSNKTNWNIFQSVELFLSALINTSCLNAAQHRACS